MPGFMPGIHALLDASKDVDGRTLASEATPFFERLWSGRDAPTETPLSPAAHMP